MLAEFPLLGLVPVSVGRQVGNLVQDVIAFGGEVEFPAARVGEQAAYAGRRDARALFEQGEVGQPVALPTGQRQAESLLHRGQQMPDRGAASAWSVRAAGVGHVPSPGYGWLLGIGGWSGATSHGHCLTLSIRFIAVRSRVARTQHSMDGEFMTCRH
jgi:hypothetical protein